MNSYTKKEMFKCDAHTILRDSSILIPEECVIHDGVLYERLGSLKCDDTGHRYRFFFSVDDYDYLENDELADKLDLYYE